MSRKHSRQKAWRTASQQDPDASWEARYQRVCDLVQAGSWKEARALHLDLANDSKPKEAQALVENDLGVLAALDGDLTEARRRLEVALVLNPDCVSAQRNAAILYEPARHSPVALNTEADSETHGTRPTRVAVVSLLFNWPSTGGGTVHTAETVRFLSQAGYDVRHFYAQYEPWGIGRVSENEIVGGEPIQFGEPDWTAPTIQQRFRERIDLFAPDFVIITDSWNFKPLLAEALKHHRYFLRLAAQECLCPLNNVRLLVHEGQPKSCPLQQLATPDECLRCVAAYDRLSGGLHQVERRLAGYGTREYTSLLKDAFLNAEAILVVNPLIAAMVAPYSKRVCVVPSGFDPARFAGPMSVGSRPTGAAPLKLLFAGLTDEYMKGFHVLQSACRKLWKQRRDFELMVTAERPESPEPFEQYVGWKAQEELPDTIRDADILIFPTIAEEALGRTAVEAMGAGRPVIASRIGGLQFTVIDGLTGLLFEPNNADDLSSKIEQLLDNPQCRSDMGNAGRKRFDSDYTWDVIINRYYRPLLGPSIVSSEKSTQSSGRKLISVVQKTSKSIREPLKVAIATRSFSDDLYELSGEFLDFRITDSEFEPQIVRYRIMGKRSDDYFRNLLAIDADFVINMDEDVFLLDPKGVLDLIRQMQDAGYAAAGVPDGGVVAIREHNPVACNAFFNVFDLRKIRPIWADWDRVRTAQYQSNFETQIPSFAQRTAFNFDHYESYYGVFFSLLSCGERILYLDAKEWSDTISTVVMSPAGRPLLIHSWYAREWPVNPMTRQRIENVVEFARSTCEFSNPSCHPVQNRGAYRPDFPKYNDKNELIRAASECFGVPIDYATGIYKTYHAFHLDKGYTRRFGELKTLSFEEAFVICVALALHQPPVIIEIGTHYGRSTRRLLDIKELLGLKSQMICFDVMDEVRYFACDEADLILEDLKGRVRRDVLERYEPGLIFIDTHEHPLLREVISGVLTGPNGWLLTIHDCGRGNCNPRMTSSVEDVQINSETGVWERHILADLFHIEDPMSVSLDECETGTHQLKIFETLHGLALIRPQETLPQIEKHARTRDSVVLHV